MISRDQVTNRIGAEGWVFSREAKHVYIFRKKGSGNAQRINLPKRDLYPELLVRVVLSQAGLKPKEIESFITNAAKS